MLLRLTDVHQGECIGRDTGYGCRKELGMPLRGLEGCLAVDLCKVQPRNFFSTPQLLELQGSTPQLLNDDVSGDQSPPQLEVISNTDVERSMACFGGAWRDV